MPKISALSSGTPASTSLLVAVVNSTTVKISVADITALVAGGLPTATGTMTSGGMLYGNASGQISSLAIGTSGYILESTAGFPAWRAAAAGGLPTATGTMSSGAILYGNSSGQVSSLAIGTSGYYLQSTGGFPTWVALPAYPATNTIPVSTGIISSGSILYGNSSGQFSSLAIGGSGYHLESTAGIPAWRSPIRYIGVQAVPSTVAIASGLQAQTLHIPAGLAGYNLTYVHGLHSASKASAGRTTFKIMNVTDGTSMCSSYFDIDSGVVGSNFSASQGLIDTAKDDVAANDILGVHVTDVPSASAPTGLSVTLGFSLP